MSKSPVGIDELLIQVGAFGLFQWLFNGAFCVMVLPMTYQVLIMYFLAQKPPWKCAINSSVCLLNGTMSSHDTLRCSMPRSEWVYTEPVDYSIVTQFDIHCEHEWMLNLTTAMFFIGAALGALFLGWMGDNFGRKLTFFPSITCLIIIGFASSFLPGIQCFIVFRFIVGFFYAGSFSQTWIMVSEFVDSKHRPVVGMCILFFYSVSLVLLGLKAYFAKTWKILLIVCTAPYIFVLSFYKFIPESIRWMHLKGHVSDVMNVFERVGRWNKRMISPDIVLARPMNISKHRSTIKDLFRTCNFAITTVIQACSWFANSVVYYGLSLAADDLGGSIYLNFILLSIMEFPAYIAVAYLCERFGRKMTTISSMLIGSILCVVIASIPVSGSIKVARVVLGMFGKLFITMSYSCMYTWSAEIYPTKIRACGIGFLQLLEMVGGACSPFIAKGLQLVSTKAPFLVMGSIAFVSAGSLFLLPETKGIDVVDETETTPLFVDV